MALTAIKRREGRLKRIQWLKRRNMFFMFRSASFQGIDKLFLGGVARRMKKDGLYAPTTAVVDIVVGLRRILRNELTK
jgi:hypothetical protein